MEKVHALMKSGVEKGVFPGAVLLVAEGIGEKHAVLFHEAYGLANLFTRRPVRKDTVFDLASLTKPLATALAVLRLVQTGELALDSTLGALLPPCRNTPLAGISLSHLLNHTSGLPAYRPFYQTLKDLLPDERTAALRRALAGELPEAPIGAATRYSDLGFMFLNWVVEDKTGISIGRFVEKEVYAPLGIRSLFPHGLLKGEVLRNCAATEMCPWRGKLLEGEVHDDNAWVVGGMEGHAGLFGDAGGVVALLHALLSAFHGKPASETFRPEAVRTFLERPAGDGRALGFDVPSLSGSSSGCFFSRSSVGHLGFTGTSFWIDLEKRLMVVLLTNRVHPTRENDRIRAFRPRLHDQVMNFVAKRSQS